MKVLVAGDKSPITHRAVSCFGLLPRHEPDCSNIEFSTGSIRLRYTGFRNRNILHATGGR